MDWPIANLTDIRLFIQAGNPLSSATFSPTFDSLTLSEHLSATFLASVAGVLSQFDPIKSLTLTCSPSNFVAFTAYFSKSTKLQSLSIKNVHNLSPEVQLEIFEKIGNSSSNFSLELFGETDAHSVDISVIKNAHAITNMTLECKLVCSSIFTENIQKFVNLKSLRLLDYFFTETEGVDSSEIISFLPNLTSFHYGKVKKSEKIDKFFQNVEVHPSIKELSLSLFEISPENGHHIKKMFRNNTILEELSIHDWSSKGDQKNTLTDLFSGIKLNTTLKSLKLSTKITNEELEELGEAIEDKINLTSLFIVSLKQIDPVLSKLGTLKNLKDLKLLYCKITDFSISKICDCLSRNYPLESLGILISQISDKNACYIFDSLKTNNHLTKITFSPQTLTGIFHKCEEVLQNNITLSEIKILNFSENGKQSLKNILLQNSCKYCVIFELFLSNPATKNTRLA